MIVWNESKRLKVIENHKVDFALITDIFDDSYGLYREDTEHSDDDEIRYSVIGATAEYGLILQCLFMRTMTFVLSRQDERKNGW